MTSFRSEILPKCGYLIWEEHRYSVETDSGFSHFVFGYLSSGSVITSVSTDRFVGDPKSKVLLRPL